MQTPKVIVGHLAPDLDCLIAIWIFARFGGAADAELVFVPAGSTFADSLVDTDPTIVHVDTGGGCFDHHQALDHSLSAAELVRRALIPSDPVLQRLVAHVTHLDNADIFLGKSDLLFNVNDLIHGFNALFPDKPQHVAQAMMPNFDAWYAYEQRQVRLECAFSYRREFHTCWGLGIAMQSNDGGSSRLAYGQGAVLYAYRDGRGNMGIAAQSRSTVDLEPVYVDLQRIDATADWYLHPNRRMLLCGTAKAPPRHRSQLTLEELVDVLQETNRTCHN